MLASHLDHSDELLGRTAAPRGRDLLALVCPDWRAPSLVLDGCSGVVVYANGPCLKLMAEGHVMRLQNGRPDFLAPGLTDRFQATLSAMLAQATESAMLVEMMGGGTLTISIAIHNTQGFYRDVLQRSVSDAENAGQLVVAEIATSQDEADSAALHAFAQKFALTSLEREIADLTLRGLSAREIATWKNMPHPMLRQRLDSLLAKTHCRSQSELVRMVMTLCPTAPRL
jgi:DNA-binding CsgD family transcriptional regulator